MTRHPLRNIQLLRAIAALMVVGYHLYALPVGWYHPGGTFLLAGVDIFFVISGFIMVYTTRPGTTPMAFMRNRVERIVPLYWLLTLLTFVLAATAPRLFASTHADVGALAKSLLFIPYVKDSGLIRPLLFVGWTLDLEMLFYVLFALSLAVPRHAVPLVTAGLVGLVAMGSVAVDTVARFVTSDVLLEFAAGMWLARLRPHLCSHIGRGAAAVLVIVGAVCLVFPPSPTIRMLAAGLPALAIVAGAVALEEAGHAMTRPLPLLLGSASYAIYLTHPFVTQAAHALFDRATLPVRFVAAALALLVVVLVGIATQRLVEQPIAHLLKRRRLTDARFAHHPDPVIG